MSTTNQAVKVGIKFLMIAMSLAMVGIVIVTSIKSDLFHLPSSVVKEPWFLTTLIDFYFNITIISVWMFYKEANLLRSLMWLIAFISLGSIATAFYVFLQFVTLKESEGIKEVLLKRDIQ